MCYPVWHIYCKTRILQGQFAMYVCVLYSKSIVHSYILWWFMEPYFKCLQNFEPNGTYTKGKLVNPGWSWHPLSCVVCDNEGKQPPHLMCCAPHNTAGIHFMHGSQVRKMQHVCGALCHPWKYMGTFNLFGCSMPHSDDALYNPSGEPARLTHSDTLPRPS